MPIIREARLSPEYQKLYAINGPCVSLGKEIWWISGKLLRMGTVEKIDEITGTIHVTNSQGTIKLRPENTIILLKAPKGMKKKSR